MSDAPMVSAALCDPDFRIAGPKSLSADRKTPGAEKISRASIGMLNPISQALYPRIANLLEGKPGSASRFARLGFVLMAGGGLMLGVAVFLLAPWLVHLLLGSGYEPAILVLRILAMLHPITAINNMLGIQWMVPLRLDRAFNTIVLGGGVLNVLLAVILALTLAQTGPAWASIVSQSLVMATMIATLARLQLLPSQKEAKQ
jgi:polysaccharide transporter, PST family